MLWQIFQLAVFAAVVGSNIQWNWTPNMYLASLMGGAAAFVLTAAISWFMDFLTRLKLKSRLRHKKLN